MHHYYEQLWIDAAAYIGGFGNFGSMCPQCGRATMIQDICYGGCVPAGHVVCPGMPPHNTKCVLCRGKGFVEERIE